MFCSYSAASLTAQEFGNEVNGNASGVERRSKVTKVVAPEMSVDRLALSRLCEDDARRKIATAQPAGRVAVAKGNFSQLTVVIFCGCYFARYHRTEVKALSHKAPPE